MLEGENSSLKGKLIIVPIGFIPEVVSEQIKGIGVPPDSTIILVGMYFDSQSREKVEEAASSVARELSGLAPTKALTTGPMEPGDAAAWLAEILWREWRPGGAVFLLGGGSRVLFAASILTASLAAQLGVAPITVYVSRDYEPRILYRVPLPPPVKHATSDYKVLTALLSGEATQEELEAATGLSRPSISRSLHRLHSQGLAAPLKAGARRTPWRLTPIGRTAALLLLLLGRRPDKS